MRPEGANCLHGSERGSGYYNSVLFVCLFVCLSVCIYGMPGRVIVGSVVVDQRSMCDVNCSSAITPHCLVLICLCVCVCVGGKGELCVSMCVFVCVFVCM